MGRFKTGLSKKKLGKQRIFLILVALILIIFIGWVLMGYGVDGGMMMSGVRIFFGGGVYGWIILIGAWVVRRWVMRRGGDQVMGLILIWLSYQLGYAMWSGVMDYEEVGVLVGSLWRVIEEGFGYWGGVGLSGWLIFRGVCLVKGVRIRDIWDRLDIRGMGRGMGRGMKLKKKKLPWIQKVENIGDMVQIEMVEMVVRKEEGDEEGVGYGGYGGRKDEGKNEGKEEGKDEGKEEGKEEGKKEEGVGILYLEWEGFNGSGVGRRGEGIEEGRGEEEGSQGEEEIYIYKGVGRELGDIYEIEEGEEGLDDMKDHGEDEFKDRRMEERMKERIEEKRGFQREFCNFLMEEEDRGAGGMVMEEEVGRKLVETLEEFGIELRVVNIERGPVITRYEVVPSPGIKLSKIVNLQDNISLALASSKVRIVAPIPGKSRVGVEIPNERRKILRLKELLTSQEFEKERELPVALGKGISGQVEVIDLTRMPHLLIAGATGSGKSVFVNTLICSLLYGKRKEEIKFIMIDPKRVELKVYDEMPYLLSPVITEVKKAVTALKWLSNEMEDRYKLLEKYGCRDIRSYNQKRKRLKEKDYIVGKYLEYLVIIIDEFADLMMLSAKDVEGYVSRLAAMSRAVGIHLVIATQRPSVDVITGLIKANFPARISFQVSSKMESRIILDYNGADKLLGRGDFLFYAPETDGLLRLQGAYLEDNEVNEVSHYIKSFGSPNYIKELEFIGNTDEDCIHSIEDEPLFKEAVEIILSDRKVSASYLQRKMRIGYNRAARIIELMEKEGIIGLAYGNNKREILI